MMNHILIEVTPDLLPAAVSDATVLDAILYRHVAATNSLDLLAISDGILNQIFDVLCGRSGRDQDDVPSEKRAAARELSSSPTTGDLRVAPHPPVDGEKEEAPAVAVPRPHLTSDVASNPALGRALDLLRLPREALEKLAHEVTFPDARPKESPPSDLRAPAGPDVRPVERDGNRLWYEEFPGYLIECEPSDDVAVLANRFRNAGRPNNADLADWFEAIATFYIGAAARNSAVLNCIL